MNCSPTIAIALLLLSLTAGMWLLYKTQKENLGMFFKIVGWFIIVVSLGSMVCCGIRCIWKSCKQKKECHYYESCGTGMDACRRERGMSMMGYHCGMNKRMMTKGKDGCCEDGMRAEKGCCGEEEAEGENCKMDCCKNEGTDCEKKSVIEKDSVVVKKGK